MDHRGPELQCRRQSKGRLWKERQGGFDEIEELKAWKDRGLAEGEWEVSGRISAQDVTLNGKSKRPSVGHFGFKDSAAVQLGGLDKK